jgi:hypothetical protein
MTHKFTANALDAWRQHANKQRRLFSIASSGARRMFNRSLALALGRWMESTAELRWQRQVRAFIKSQEGNNSVRT